MTFSCFQEDEVDTSKTTPPDTTQAWRLFRLYLGMTSSGHFPLLGDAFKSESSDSIGRVFFEKDLADSCNRNDTNDTKFGKVDCYNDYQGRYPSHRSFTWSQEVLQVQILRTRRNEEKHWQFVEFVEIFDTLYVQLYQELTSMNV